MVMKRIYVLLSQKAAAVVRSPMGAVILLLRVMAGTCFSEAVLINYGWQADETGCSLQHRYRQSMRVWMCHLEAVVVFPHGHAQVPGVDDGDAQLGNDGQLQPVAPAALHQHLVKSAGSARRFSRPVSWP